MRLLGFAGIEITGRLFFMPIETENARIVERRDFGRLIEALHARGYTVVGPTLRDQAIVYEELESVEDLPIGWTDEHEGGHYRVKRRDDAALFGYVSGPHSWKHFLHPPRLRLFRSHRDQAGDLGFETETDSPVPRYAFLGVRSCDLHAIAIQDRVFLGSGYTDTPYARRREGIFTIAVNCGTAGATCFCVSMQTGPAVSRKTPHDLALTEIIDADRHFFLVTPSSYAGEEVLAELPSVKAGKEEIAAAQSRVDRTAAHMGRQMKADDVKELLYKNLEHPRWDDVAARCLTCANCTMVCPTCFCTTVEDVTDLTGDHAERWRRWDSCFTMDFTYMHGGSVRQSGRSRYRQWMTHKLATWHDQFGSSGCVGCGRCITWCPVGIDITEEVAAIRRPTSSTPTSDPP